MIEALTRHRAGDWGHMPPAVARRNREALRAGGPLASRYELPGGGAVWVVTAGDRSATFVLYVPGDGPRELIVNGSTLRRLTFEECVAAGFCPSWQGAVLALRGAHPDAPADRPEPVAAFEVETPGGPPLRFVLQGEEELMSLRDLSRWAMLGRRG